MVRKKHATLPPKYAPFGEYREVADMLKKRTWRAREVLNFTVKTFYNRKKNELSVEQREAQDEFVETYRKQITEFNKRGLGKDPKDPTVDNTLTRYKDLLDRYFFLGTMTEYHLTVRGYTADSQGKTAIPCESWKDNRIYVPMSNATEPFDLRKVVALIVHEMTHIYLNATVCVCEDCSKNDMNDVGVADDRHGPIFQILNRLVVTEIRKWHDILRDFDERDCPPKCTSLYSQKAHLRAYGRTDMVRGEGVVVAVRNKLLNDQRAVEERLRAKDDVVTDSDSESESSPEDDNAQHQHVKNDHNADGTTTASGNDEARAKESQPAETTV